MLPIGLPAIPQETVLQEPPRQVNSQQFDGGLRIEYDGVEHDLETGLTIFTGRVRAFYDLTEVRANSLRLDEKNKVFEAEGAVEIIDPEAYAKCERIWATWVKPPPETEKEAREQFVMGRAYNMEFRSGNVRLEARETIIHPGRWVMHDVSGAISRSDDPPYGIFARRVSLKPGESGVAERVYLEVLGRRIGALPRYTFSLNKRVKGLGLPAVKQERGRGIGVGWNANIPFGDKSALNAGIESFPSEFLKLGLEFAYSPLSSDATEAKINPRSDLGERFSDGWFENISVPVAGAEQNELRKPRLTYSAATRWNEGTIGRPENPGSVSKQFELGWESGGELGNGFGSFFQARLQRIRSGPEDPWVDRALFQSTLLAPDYRLANGLDFRVRADGFLTQSERNTFAWVRGSAGLIYQPYQGLTLGAAYIASTEFGDPDLRFDPLYSRNAAHFRVDWQSGPYSVKYLYKYDINTAQWYDREWEIALVAEGFEPFIRYRQNPSDYRIGVRFRIDNFVDKLINRDPKRGRPAAKKS